MTPEQARIVDRLRSKDPMAARNRAALEFQLYQTVKSDAAERGGIGQVLARFNLGYSTAEIEGRSRLRSAADAADPLWMAMEAEGLPLRTARILLVQAMRRSSEATPGFVAGYEGWKEECERALEAWRERSVVVRGPGGQLVRRHKQGAKTIDPNRAIDDIRDRAVTYATAHGRTIPKAEARNLVAEFVGELDALLSGFELRVKREQKRAIDGAEDRVSHRKVREACETLNLPKPRPGERVDVVELKKHYRALAAQYHPDRTGNEESRHLFEAVVAAYRLLEQYNEEIPDDGVEGREART